jgi:hypothetical protein
VITCVCARAYVGALLFAYMFERAWDCVSVRVCACLCACVCVCMFVLECLRAS